MAKTGKNKTTNQHKNGGFALRTPKLSILSDHPLEEKIAYDADRFSLRYWVGPVYDIIRHEKTQMPMTIAIYGGWGTGKTTAMKWLEGLLGEWNQNPTNGIKVWPVWFYPWKYHNKEDVWRGLLSEVIIEAIDVKKITWEKTKNAAKQFGLFLGKSFLHALASVKFKVRSPGGMAEAEADLASLKEIISEYQQTAHPEKAYLNEFESSLKNWVRDTLGDNERMGIFIDDLYRCMPEVFGCLPTWSVFVLTSWRDFERVVGRRADRRRKLYNAQLECTYYQYHGPRPPKPAAGNDPR